MCNLFVGINSISVLIYKSGEWSPVSLCTRSACISLCTRPAFVSLCSWSACVSLCTRPACVSLRFRSACISLSSRSASVSLCTRSACVKWCTRPACANLRTLSACAQSPSPLSHHVCYKAPGSVRPFISFWPPVQWSTMPSGEISTGSNLTPSEGFTDSGVGHWRFIVIRKDSCQELVSVPDTESYGLCWEG